MIGQYLPNNNEKRYRAILPKNLDLNRPSVACTGIVSHATMNTQQILNTILTVFQFQNLDRWASPHHTKRESYIKHIALDRAHPSPITYHLNTVSHKVTKYHPSTSKS
jgi:hypothetical protein